MVSADYGRFIDDDSADKKPAPTAGSDKASCYKDGLLDYSAED